MLKFMIGFFGKIIIAFVSAMYRRKRYMIPCRSVCCYPNGLIRINGISMVPLVFMPDTTICVRQLMDTMTNNKEVYQFIFT